MLNPRQEKFAENYARHGNGTKAAKDAGYAERSAHVQASRLLKNDKVRERIAYYHAQRHMGPEETMAALADIARTDMGDFITPQMHGGARLNLRKAHRLRKLGLIREIQTEEEIAQTDEGKINTGVLKTKVKLYDKQRALETIARHHGLLKDNEININITIHLQGS